MDGGPSASSAPRCHYYSLTEMFRTLSRKRRSGLNAQSKRLFNSASVGPDKCIFCRIVRGDLPSNKVYEDEHYIAFLDINPFSRGHTLVSPKEHG